MTVPPLGGDALMDSVPAFSTVRPMFPTRSGVFAVKFNVGEVTGPPVASVLTLNVPFAPL